MRIATTLTLAAMGLAAVTTAAQARDHLKIVGSSTVYPYAQAVSEEFAKAGNKAPVLESTGSGGGMKIFCQGVGAEHPDITNASRAMKKSEFELCNKNGVTDITEIQVGYDGLSIANSKKGKGMNLTLPQVFLALSAKVPVDGKLVDNPYKKWSDIDKSLPNIDIVAYGPPPTSGTRDAFVELAMHGGCKKIDFYKGKDKKFIKANCTSMRQDGPFIEAGENDNLIVQRLDADPNAVGIFGYSFLYENLDKLQAVKIAGVEPTFETIGDKSYPISRPLFFYVKNAHRKVTPGMEDYLAEFTSDNAMGEGGYLTERGLVVLSKDMLKEMQDRAKNGTKMESPAGS